MAPSCAGYRRLEGLAAAAALSRLDAASRLLVNSFQPSFKLASKTRVGAKVRKTYHAPETPYAKLLSIEAVTDEMKERLRAVAVQLDPLRLLEEIRSVQHHLAALAAGQTTHLAPRHEGSLDGFLTGVCLHMLVGYERSGAPWIVAPQSLGSAVSSGTSMSTQAVPPDCVPSSVRSFFQGTCHR
jgi:hypothetical protein